MEINMATAPSPLTDPPYRRHAPHPLHAILLAFPVALFSSALLSDITYLNSAEMQWSNFSAWLITGGLIFGAPVLLWSAIALVRRRKLPTRTPALAYFLLILIMWIAGLVNAFKHSQDAWSSVGTTGVTLSALSTLAAIAAAWLLHAAKEPRA
ncbi:DUF2231 domain-containing protein [Sphingopyxis sp. OPL5]|uniref:DUF2231 domain-containing protein n=1 Tax=Sphingopyxis sp. OPL5 TaxID=2486273 RepID=UPI00223A80AD|nr:DUF2231 domain-containing protein [Sphingopyxis sp. OPL5]